MERQKEKGHRALVSVVMPLYNAEAYIAETLDSVLASTYREFEVVVVDDGSTDGSLGIAEMYAERDRRIRVYSQENAGVSEARNRAVALSEGKYILPFDADDIMLPGYIASAVGVLEERREVRVVTGEGEYFQDRAGAWRLKPFSLRMLARKNMIPVCSMYRRDDYNRTDGYSRELKYLEDWDFWLSIFEHGGELVKLPELCFRYRVHGRSSRLKSRGTKRDVVQVLNRRHKWFFYKYLGGPLRYSRSCSRFINWLFKIIHNERYVTALEDVRSRNAFYTIPERFDTEGAMLYSKRNVLKEIACGDDGYVVKRFAKPNWFNRVVYGALRQSKAERSYRYAQMLLECGIGTPCPVGYITFRRWLLFDNSYYVCEKSKLPILFNTLIDQRDYPHRDELLAFVGERTARLHEAGFLPLDYSGGNILLGYEAGGMQYQLIDLNRMRTGVEVGIDMGCRNFERLNVEAEALEVMARSYGAARGFDADKCVELIKRYRWKKHR